MSFTRNNVILIGETGVGKTSLLRRFIDNVFTGNEMPTHGVAFRSVDYNYDGLQLKIAIWDSSSLPQYRQVSRLYYKDVSAALIVYDVSDRASYERTNYWINAIREHSNIIKYIAIVGNKLDLRDRWEARHVTRREGLEFANRKNVEFVECSAKVDINVAELFSKTFDGMIKRYVLTPIVKSTLRYKTIVLGDRGVGKSCLIERLCGHPFPKSATSGHQMGAQYSSTVVKINQRSVIMEFWDTSGQSEEESVIQLMPMCYRSAHTVILVYDIQCRQSFDNLSKYLSLLDNTCAEEMPFVVLLGNKRDDKSAVAVNAIEAAEFVDTNPAIGVFEELSAKCDTHFEKLLTKICRNLIITFPNIPLHQNIRIKNRHHKQKTKLKNWFKCGAKYIQD